MMMMMMMIIIIIIIIILNTPDLLFIGVRLFSVDLYTALLAASLNKLQNK
jgi:hypothetical protein